jgi:hypothetical protein
MDRKRGGIIRAEAFNSYRMFGYRLRICFYTSFYLLLFFWTILQRMSGASPVIPQEKPLGAFSALLLLPHMSSGGCALPL